MATDAPTGRAIGAVAPVPSGAFGGIASWASFANQVREHVPELTGTRRYETFETMLNDAEIDSHVTGTFLPLEEYDLWLDLNGCDEGMVLPLAEDLGLPTGDRDGPVADTPTPWRAEGSLDFREHWREAGLATLYGVYDFELEGELRDGLWRLGALYPRHPSTVTARQQDPISGNLIAIRQSGVRSSGNGAAALMPRPIPAVRLLPYVWRPDAKRRWEGRPMLRPIYREWMVKDLLIRLDVTNHERAGGVPVVRTDHTYAGGNLSQLAQMAMDFRVDEEGGGALPPGAWIELLAAGQGDRIASIRYCDQQIAKTWHQMVRELGTTETGSRALGATFGDLEALARRAIGRWLCTNFTQRLIFRWWGWNYGESETAPILRASPPDIEGSDDPVEEEAEANLTAIAARSGGPKPTRQEVRAAAQSMRRARFGPEWRGCSA